jgi:class 3 adenylate cyclase/tetratricopeptide (TPR) repeat protein
VGERKPVTAVFADIVGFTSLAEQIDPEDWTEIINAAFEQMSRRIFDYEGTIAQIQGDAIISFFGAPVAHEDDPERAVRAALAMITAMDEYGRELKLSEGFDFQIRIGIATGVVLVGNVGSDLRYDYTAIGDTMNLASRLESAAPPGGILIADKTERFVRPYFELEDIGTLELKGKSAAVQVYRVRGERSQPGPTRGVPGLESPMVGRSKELDTLLGITSSTQAGHGGVAIVVAEPGIGKSRLLSELRSKIHDHERGATANAAERETAWITGQSVSYGTRMPFHVITSLLFNVLSMNQASSPREVDLALRNLLAELLPDDDEVHGYLAYLMGLDADADTAGPNTSGASPAVRPTGEFLAERLAGALLRLLRQVSRQGPLVIAIEDLHWADTASVDLIKALLTLPDDSPVLLVATTREEPNAPGWEVLTTARERMDGALTEIRLEPLDRLGSQIMVANMLEIDSLPMPTRDLILDKADGNPLFMEEVIRMLVESGAIESRDGRWVAVVAIDQVAIPDTVHGLVLARIDQLPDGARKVLRLASCIDGQFSLPILEDVSRARGSDESIAPAIDQLEAANLVVLAGTDPELEYRFSHALIQDAAYETVLRKERREWHQLVAQAIVARYPERQDELAAQLARHFELAGESSRAVDYLLIAADRALARNAMVDAGGLYGHASNLLDAAPEDPDALAAGRRRLRIFRGTLTSRVDFLHGKDTLDFLATGRALAERLGDDSALSDVLFWEIALRQSSGERAEDSAALRDAVESMSSLAGVTGDDVHRAQALARGGMFMWWRGEFQRRIDSLQQAGALFRKAGDVIGASMAESYMAADLASIGSFDEADQRIQESRILSEAADTLAKLDFQLAEAAVAGIRGDHGTSIKFAGQCFKGSAEIGALACATVSGMVLGYSQMAVGDVSGARESLERSIEFATQGYLAPMRLRAHVLLAAVDGVSGDMDKAESGFDQALQGFGSMGGTHGEAEAHLARGMVLATHPAGDAHRALEDLDAAAVVFSTLGARPALARTQRARGLALARIGEAAEADGSLVLAATMADEMGLKDGPWPASLAELQAMQAAEVPIQTLD